MYSVEQFERMKNQYWNCNRIHPEIYFSFCGKFESFVPSRIKFETE